MKTLLIALGGLIVLFIGYFFSVFCDVSIDFPPLNYLQEKRCGIKKQSGEEGTLPKSVYQPTPNQPPKQTETNQNETNQNGVRLLYDKKIADYFITNRGEIIIIDNFGKIIKLVSGKEEIINETLDSIPREIIFSKDESKIIFVFKNSINVFDTQTREWRQVTETSGEVAALSPKNELVYFKNNNSIFKLDLNNKNSSPQKLIDINNLDYYLLWKNEDGLFILSKPSSLVVGTVLLLNTKNKELSLVYELPGFDINWNANMDIGLIFYTSRLGRGGKLFWTDKNLKNNELSFLTIPQKCTFGEKLEKNKNQQTNDGVLICAIPKNQNLLKNKTVLDDWLTYDLYTEDDIYKINLEDGIIEPILKNRGGLDVSNIKFSKDKIFFINRFDKKLYSIDL